VVKGCNVIGVYEFHVTSKHNSPHGRVVSPLAWQRVTVKIGTHQYRFFQALKLLLGSLRKSYRDRELRYGEFPLRASDFRRFLENIAPELLIRSGNTHLIVAISIRAKRLGNDAECDRADFNAVSLSQQLRVSRTPRRREAVGQHNIVPTPNVKLS